MRIILSLLAEPQSAIQPDRKLSLSLDFIYRDSHQGIADQLSIRYP
ncbi:MAG: hypothetical protein WCL60_03060 [Methylococcales bacterium]